MKLASINIFIYTLGCKRLCYVALSPSSEYTFMQGQAHGQKKQHSQYMWAANLSTQKEEKK